VNLDKKTKNAIENLIILARYALDNSVSTKEDLSLAKKSIKACERLIGREVEEEAEIEIAGINVDEFAALVKKR
jgi:hypothetical protein